RASAARRRKDGLASVETLGESRGQAAAASRDPRARLPALGPGAGFVCYRSRVMTERALAAPAVLGPRALSLVSRARPYALALVVSGLLAVVFAREIVLEAGHAAVPLDDSFIHFQYAKRIAEGHFFSYVAGQGYTTGATSFLWPIALAPFFWLGVKDVG